MADIIKEFEEKTEKTKSVLKEDLNTVRAGRANPALLNGIVVEYYGVPTPLKNMSNVSAPDPRTIQIMPFDPKSIGNIERAINIANLGINPSNDGKCIRLVIPPLTEERRKELCKQAKTEVENAKVNVRNVRRNVMDKVKKLKDKSVPEDEVKQVEKELQDITDKNIAECDKIFAAKEKEIMSI